MFFLSLLESFEVRLTNFPKLIYTIFKLDRLKDTNVNVFNLGSQFLSSCWRKQFQLHFRWWDKHLEVNFPSFSEWNSTHFRIPKFKFRISDYKGASISTTIHDPHCRHHIVNLFTTFLSILWVGFGTNLEVLSSNARCTQWKSNIKWEMRKSTSETFSNKYYEVGGHRMLTVDVVDFRLFAQSLFMFYKSWNSAVIFEILSYISQWNDILTFFSESSGGFFQDLKLKCPSATLKLIFHMRSIFDSNYHLLCSTCHCQNPTKNIDWIRILLFIAPTADWGVMERIWKFNFLSSLCYDKKWNL